MTVVPTVERRGDRPWRIGRRRDGASEQRSLQQVGERADGQLCGQPDQIGRESAMHRSGSDRVLVARQRRRKQRARIETAVLDGGPNVFGRLAGAAGGEIAAQAEKRIGEDRDGERDGLASQDHQRSGSQLRGDVLARQRQTRQPAAFECPAQADHAFDQLPLEVDRAVELGTVGDDRRPSALGDRADLGARGGGHQNVGHVMGAQRLQPCDGRAVYQSRSCYTVEC